MTNDTMPSNSRRYFNSDLLSSDHRIFGSNNLNDAIKIVGRKHCLPTGHGEENNNTNTAAADNNSNTNNTDTATRSLSTVVARGKESDDDDNNENPLEETSSLCDEKKKKKKYPNDDSDDDSTVQPVDETTEKRKRSNDGNGFGPIILASNNKQKGPPRHSIARTGRWAPDEEILFLYGLRLFGKGKWKKLSCYLPHRSLIQIKSHGQKVLKRQEAGENIFHQLEENYHKIDHLIADATNGDDDGVDNNNRKTNDTMSSKSRPYFNYDLLSSIHNRISGSDNPDDAIKTVGRKYVRSKKGHRWEGVLIYGQRTNCPITSIDYRAVHNGDPLEDYKRLYIIINSLHFHLCFFIFHIDADKLTRSLFEDLMNLANANSLTFNQMNGRRRSKPLVRFAEQWVTRLTKEDQDNLLVLNNLPTDKDKIRAVYLVLKHGWDYVLQPNFITKVLPRICEMTVVEFKAEHGVDVDVIIERSTILYGQYFDELDHHRTRFKQRANEVGEWTAPIASEENSSDDDGDDNNNEGSTVLSISSSTNNGTGKRKREEDSDDDDNNGDDDDDEENRSKPDDVQSISSSTNNRVIKKRHNEDSDDNNHDDNDDAGDGAFDNDFSMNNNMIDENGTELVEDVSNPEEAENFAPKQDYEDSLEYVNYDETEDEALDNEAALVAILRYDEDEDEARERDQEVVSGEARDQDHRGVLVEMNRIEAEDEARVNRQKLVAARNTIENLQHQFRAERTRSAAERVRFANQLTAERVHSANQLAAERVRSANLERQLAYAQSLLHGSEHNINNTGNRDAPGVQYPADVMDTSDTNGIGTSNSFNIHINNSNNRNRSSNDNNNINIKINVPPTNRN